jgi:hypothetical protein
MSPDRRGLIMSSTKVVSAHEYGKGEWPGRKKSVEVRSGVPRGRDDGLEPQAGAGVEGLKIDSSVRRAASVEMPKMRHVWNGNAMQWSAVEIELTGVFCCSLIVCCQAEIRRCLCGLGRTHAAPRERQAKPPPPKPKRVFRKPVEARLHLGPNIIATFPAHVSPISSLS